MKTNKEPIKRCGYHQTLIKLLRPEKKQEIQDEYTNEDLMRSVEKGWYHFWSKPHRIHLKNNPLFAKKKKWTGQ